MLEQVPISEAGRWRPCGGLQGGPRDACDGHLMTAEKEILQKSTRDLDRTRADLLAWLARKLPAGSGSAAVELKDVKPAAATIHRVYQPIALAAVPVAAKVMLAEQAHPTAFHRMHRHPLRRDPHRGAPQQSFNLINR